MTVPRTDLALEAADDLAARTKKISPPEGIRRLESLQEGYAVTDIRITNDAGAQALGRPVGRYITVDLRPYFDRQRTFSTGRSGASPSSCAPCCPTQAPAPRSLWRGWATAP